MLVVAAVLVAAAFDAAEKPPASEDCSSSLGYLRQIDSSALRRGRWPPFRSFPAPGIEVHSNDFVAVGRSRWYALELGSAVAPSGSGSARRTRITDVGALGGPFERMHLSLAMHFA